jgi:hypothetical protein
VTAEIIPFAARTPRPKRTFQDALDDSGQGRQTWERGVDCYEVERRMQAEEERLQRLRAMIVARGGDPAGAV